MYGTGDLIAILNSIVLAYMEFRSAAVPKFHFSLKRH